ncbi:MAG: cysteine desulfurase family protein [Patescibacteria group bacterium]
MKKRIYLDHAATTYLDPRVKKAMERCWSDDFGNPSTIYHEGRKAKRDIEESRKIIAGIIKSRPEEIIFTSGGTESNNLAIFGSANKYKKGHIITTKFEHHSVLNPIKFLEKNGFDATYLDVGKDGIVEPHNVERELRPETILVSIIYANNEIGTIQPIPEIGKVIKDFREAHLEALLLSGSKASKWAVFHTDACQATGYLDMDVEKLGVDMMTVNGSKVYGPKGIGFLYVKKGVKLIPVMYGGEQENKLRPGTENVPAIVGLTEAIKIADKEKKEEMKRLTALRDYFIGRLIKEIPNVFLNGHPQKRLPNNINVSIMGVEGESTVLYLDNFGVSCSTGSACTSDSLEPSHVIMALGKDYEYGHGSIRFSLGKVNKKSDIDYVMKILPNIVKKLRLISAIK